MLDVISYYMEEDVTSAHTKERMDVKDTVRVILYREIYDRKYALSRSDTTYGDTLPPEGPLDDVKPFNPTAGPTKPYTRPTEFDPDSSMPYGSNLGQPLG